MYAGVAGEALVVPSADPRNHHEAITRAGELERVDIDAMLFVPPGEGPRPTVIVVPGGYRSSGHAMCWRYP